MSGGRTGGRCRGTLFGTAVFSELCMVSVKFCIVSSNWERLVICGFVVIIMSVIVFRNSLQFADLWLKRAFSGMWLVGPLS